ncbi:serine/threonine-protein kinase [Gordonia sp. VNK1]|uniref:serine/threonine-protein kinase n=1 Tax=Gordonia oleivorans TaxID=3156618 RepID=UPI0032B3903B
MPLVLSLVDDPTNHKVKTRNSSMVSPISGTRVGKQFGQYRIEALLGKGGMGEVYKAYDTRKQRLVALKILNPTLAQDAVFQKRFQRESHIAARLGEPHVIPIHDWGEIDGILYIDMRWVDGQDLRSLLRSEGRLTPSRAVFIISQVAAALDAAHRDGLVHRDIKPENVLIGENDFAYLVDFGIAQQGTSDTKLTETGSAIGSFSYMAPERLDNVPVTSAVDVYGLGCVLYECLTGRVPFPADSISGIVKAIVLDGPPSVSTLQSGIPAAFDSVLHKALAKDPSRRQSTAGGLANEAARALEGVGSAPSAESSPNDLVGRELPTELPVGRQRGDYAPTVYGSTPPRVDTPWEYSGGASGGYAAPGQLANAPQPSGRRWNVALVLLGSVAVLALAGVIGWFVSQVVGDSNTVATMSDPGTSVASVEQPQSTVPAVTETTTVVPAIPTTPNFAFLQTPHLDCGSGAYADNRDPSHQVTCAWASSVAQSVGPRAPQQVVEGSAFSGQVGEYRSYLCRWSSGGYYECSSQIGNIFWVVP